MPLSLAAIQASVGGAMMAKKKKTTKKPAGKKKVAAKKKTKKKVVKKAKASVKKAAKKAAPKKTGAAKKMASGGGGSTSGVDSLCDQLKDEIKGALLSWQVEFGRSGIRQQMMAMLHSSEARAVIMQWTVARAVTYHGMIKTAKEAGNTHPWVVPWVAAMSLETVFQSSTGYWLAAGDSAATNVLKPSVVEFVDMQVDLCCAVIGGS